MLLTRLRRTRIALLAVAAATSLAGCAVTTRLQSPLRVPDFEVGKGDHIGLHLPELAKRYVWKGRINVIPYTVEFGDTFEPNVRYALERAFGRVMMLDSFPPGGSGAPQYSVSVWISDAEVSPGALTFMSSSAAVHLEAKVATGTLLHDRRIEVEGIWESSPGAAGFDVGLGRNQVAYEATLQSACEGAMREALLRLINELLLERARGPAP